MIKKLLFSLILIPFFLQAEVYEVINFESDIFSRDGNKLKKVTLTLRMEGRDLAENDYKITDALNIIISSFYLEDLFTSKGKEQFKSSLAKYLVQKYGVEADLIYFKKFKLLYTNMDVTALIDALKEEGCCTKENTMKKVFEEVQE